MTDENNSDSFTLPLISFSQNAKANSLNHEGVQKKTQLIQSTVEISKATLNQNVPPKKVDKFRHLTITGLTGLIISGVTHTAVTPLDVVKTQLQVYPNLYKNLLKAFKDINVDYGSKFGIYRGWKPICLGYSLHSFFQLGLFEYYKDKYSKWYRRPSSKDKFKVTMLAAATSELFATLILCPFEAVKVKFQTNNVKHYHEAKHNILVYEGISGFYKGLPLMLCRQIPYSVIKFTAYNEFTDNVYKKWLRIPQRDSGKFLQSLISFSVGFISGILGAIVTHPADTFIARVYHSKYPVTSKRVILGGNNGQLFCLFVRMLMLGSINGLQFCIFDTLKVAKNKNIVLV